MPEYQSTDRKLTIWIKIGLFALVFLVVAYIVMRIVAGLRTPPTSSNGFVTPSNFGNLGNLSNQAHLPRTY
ncbi:MAG: hypothetical protein PHI63_03950 [Patescibacteria group bacterium]|nr:hypothetical protein [Patescibacteria group bacterium]